MIITHSAAPIDGQPIENTFVSRENYTGDVLGRSVLFVDRNPVLYPAEPLQVRVHLEGRPLDDALIGATMARAYQICMNSGEYARIFSHCEPEDAELMNALVAFGFKDDDALIRMETKLPFTEDFPCPEHFTVLRDRLTDRQEQKYFLERYNRLYNTDHDPEWLEAFIQRENFLRLILMSPSGLAAELLLWTEGSSGVIGYLFTAKKYRMIGAAKHLIMQACIQFEQLNCYAAEINVRRLYPHVVHLLRKTGFEQTKVLMLYPGLDVAPVDR